jgi:hypothetical protein
MRPSVLIKENLMAKYQDFQNQHSVVALSGSAVDAEKLSPTLDTKGMEQVAVILVAGLATATGVLTVIIEDSPDDSVWAVVPGAAFTVLTGTSDDEQTLYGLIKCNQVGIDRYLRINVTIATDTFDYGCVAIASNLAGRIPVVTNALPAPVFDILPPTG